MIDDKLREILAIDFNFDDMSQSEWSVWHDQVIPQIKQAFADDLFEATKAGEVTYLGLPVMTGQEWYDRFEKISDDYKDEVIVGFGSRNARDIALEVARKAAGL